MERVVELSADVELARQVAAGQPEAEAELYRRLAPRVRLYGLRHLRDPAAADDLVQEVILTAFDSLRAGKVRDVRQFASFVLGTCRRVAANVRRAAQRRNQLLERHRMDLMPVESSQAPILDLARLTRCLSRLSERHRTIVVLSFYAERTAEQIGNELAMSAVNVRVLRHRALARLRHCMEARS